MAVTGVDSGSTVPTTGVDTRADVSQGEFLKLLISEISNQDPFKPLDTGEFATQLTQFESLKTNIKLSENVEALVARQQETSDAIRALLVQQQVASAGAMLGSVVRGVSADGTQVEGTVTSVSISKDGVSVILDGNVPVQMDKIVEILLPAQAGDTTAAVAGAPGATQ